jgi:hypothetical protein
MTLATQTRAGAIRTAVMRLDVLGAELTPLGWHTRLTAHPGMLPSLLIRDTAPGAPAISDDIYAVDLGGRWFYWWSRSCGSDPADAARIITRVMRSAGHRAHAAGQPECTP